MDRTPLLAAMFLSAACTAPAPPPPVVVPVERSPQPAAPCAAEEQRVMSSYPPVAPWTGPRVIGRQPVGSIDLGEGTTGRRINLDVKGADLEDVCRLLADVGRVSIVVADDIHETVTVRMRGVPWDQALDVIVRTKGLRAARDGDIILVSK